MSTGRFRRFGGRAPNPEAGIASDALGYLRDERPLAFELAGWTRERVLDADPDCGSASTAAGEESAFGSRGRLRARNLPGGDAIEFLFEHGVWLADPEGRLHGSGAQTRVFSVRSANEDTARAVGELVQQAVAERLLERG